MRTFIPVYEPDFSGNELSYVTDCVHSSRISGTGKYLDLFEEQFSKFCGTKHAVAVCNGTFALHLALLSIGIGPGDEVIVPNLTFVASANAVIYTGAKPVFADVHPSYWNIDPEDIKKRLTSHTRAIIVVHLYGHPCDMDPILEIAGKHNLSVIEDAAEAHGARYKGRTVGNLGQIAAFSFYGNKIITTGEGGMVVTNDENLAKRARFLKGQAMQLDRVYWHPEIGFNFRMTNLQAAVGLAQLERIDDLISRKRKIADQYNQYLRDVPGITLPPEQLWAKNVYWMYSILIDGQHGKTRDALRDHLQREGVETRPFFYSITDLPPYATDQPYPVSRTLSKQGINLPSGSTLTNEEVYRVSKLVKKFIS